jgi:DNA-binding NarL/FixJ family response regulator
LDASIAVLVAEGRRLFRAGLRALLHEVGDIIVIGEVARGEDAVTEVQRLHPDVLVLDAGLPGLDALPTIRLIHEAGPAQARVLLLLSDDDEAAMAALHAGAHGVLERDSTPDDLVRAVRVIAAGGALLTPAVARRLADDAASRRGHAGAPHPDLAGLTEREREVLALVGHGFSNGEIAAQIAVSPATVKTHVGNVIAKLDARDRPELVRLAYETGLLSPTRRAGPRHALRRDRR